MEELNLKEITELIQIRKYLYDTMGNPMLDKTSVSELNNTLILLDKKIVSLLKSPEFRQYINYSDVKRTVDEIARATNIKSSLKK